MVEPETFVFLGNLAKNNRKAWMSNAEVRNCVCIFRRKRSILLRD